MDEKPYESLRVNYVDNGQWALFNGDCLIHYFTASQSTDEIEMKAAEIVAEEFGMEAIDDIEFHPIFDICAASEKRCTHPYWYNILNAA